MWKFIVDVVHDFVSSLQPDVGRGFLHVSNVFLLLNRLFGRRSQKTSELRVTGLCAGSSPGTGEFPAQMASNAENVSIWWRHHDVRALAGDGPYFADFLRLNCLDL